MWSVCKKELRQFFSSLTGYIAIIVFLLVNGLVLFVFDDNIFDFGYATLDKFFQLAPWILLLLIPAITMRSFAEEFKTGTYEILQTRPLSRWQIRQPDCCFHCIASHHRLYIFCTSPLFQRRDRYGSYYWILYWVIFFGGCIYSHQYLLQQLYQQCGSGVYHQPDRMRIAVLWF
jgi:ABC-type transport system involved in cytochrome c biogenesis permease component